MFLSQKQNLFGKLEVFPGQFFYGGGLKNEKMYFMTQLVVDTIRINTAVFNEDLFINIIIKSTYNIIKDNLYYGLSKSSPWFDPWKEFSFSTIEKLGRDSYRFNVYLSA